MRKFIQKVTHPILKRIAGLYFSKPWKYTYKDITVTVHPDVFPPKFTISTKILLNYISELNLNKKRFLELGCGSGIISLFAASKGAEVTASDINTYALDYLKSSAKDNNLELNIVHSDLFSSIEDTPFDYIIINPPYYPKAPTSVKEQAWFCGENFEYFTQLFQQLQERNDKQILMILSEDCEIETIQKIAKQYHFTFEYVLEKKVVQEKNYLFQILSE